VIFAKLRLNPGTRLNGLLCWWWLRSPGNNQNNAANVNTDGSVNYNGNNVNNDNDCVRPALLPNGEKPAVSTAVSVGSKGIGFPLGKSGKTHVGGKVLRIVTMFSIFMVKGCLCTGSSSPCR